MPAHGSALRAPEDKLRPVSMAGVDPGRLSENCGLLDKRSASFEASLREAPQDEEFLLAINESLMLRSARQGASRSTQVPMQCTLYSADFPTAPAPGWSIELCHGFLFRHTRAGAALSSGRGRFA